MRVRGCQAALTQLAMSCSTDVFAGRNRLAVQKPCRCAGDYAAPMSLDAMTVGGVRGGVLSASALPPMDQCAADHSRVAWITGGSNRAFQNSAHLSSASF